MEPFTRLTAVAAPVDLPNIDTDRIIPARFLRKPKGAPGYAGFLFHDVRFNADGSEKPEFVLNQTPYRKAKLLTGRDEIGLTFDFDARIREFEARQGREMVWVVPPRR